MWRSTGNGGRLLLARPCWTARVVMARRRGGLQRFVARVTWCNAGVVRRQHDQRRGRLREHHALGKVPLGQLGFLLGRSRTRGRAAWHAAACCCGALSHVARGTTYTFKALSRYLSRLRKVLLSSAGHGHQGFHVGQGHLPEPQRLGGCGGQHLLHALGPVLAQEWRKLLLGTPRGKARLVCPRQNVRGRSLRCPVAPHIMGSLLPLPRRRTATLLRSG